MTKHERVAEEIAGLFAKDGSAETMSLVAGPIKDILQAQYGFLEKAMEIIDEKTKIIEANLDKMRGEFPNVGDRVRDSEGKLAKAREALKKISVDGTHAVVANIAFRALKEIG